MTKSEQTDEVILSLYNLTRQFTYKYQKLYYIQYRGEVEDLCADFFCDFMSEKSRVKGKEESLLDKFDENITTLPYLVKVAVKRKLIDRSRSDKGEVRIEPLVDELGDSLAEKLNLVYKDDETIDNMVFDEDDLFRAKLNFALLPKEAQNKVRSYFDEVKTCVSPNVFKIVQDVVQRDTTITIAGQACECFQVTEKSLQFIMNDEILTFNRQTGEQRASVRKYKLTEADLKKFEGVENFKR